MSCLKALIKPKRQTCLCTHTIICFLLYIIHVFLYQEFNYFVHSTHVYIAYGTRLIYNSFLLKKSCEMSFTLSYQWVNVYNSEMYTKWLYSD